MRQQNSNALSENNPGRVEGVPVELELAALDDLGPKARYAVCNGPLPVLAYSVVIQLIEHNNKIKTKNEQLEAAGLPLRPYLDAKDPALDEALAKGIMQNNLNLLATERSIEDSLAGLRPMRGKPSAKSAREQLRTDRLSRRAMR